MTIAFWCIPIAYLLVYATKIAVGVAQYRFGGGKYDNRHPRDQQAKLEGWGKRSLAAHMNGFEGFMGFAAAVLVAHVGGGNSHAADMLAVAYVISRAIYIAAYVADIHLLRSTVWSLGLGIILCLFALPAFV